MQGVGFWRPALPISVRAEVQDGDGQRATRQEERGLNVCLAGMEGVSAYRIYRPQEETSD